MFQFLFSLENFILTPKRMPSRHSPARSDNIPFKRNNSVIKSFFQELRSNFQIFHNNWISIHKLNNFFYIFIYKFFINFHNIPCKINNSIFSFCVWNYILNFLFWHFIFKVTLPRNIINCRQEIIHFRNTNIFNR